MAWLAEKEGKSAADPFCKMLSEKKVKRLNEVEKIFKELKDAEQAYYQKGVENNRVIEAIETALTNMDPHYCSLSQIDYSKLDLRRRLETEKYLERPFAYEFYHQFRKLIDEGRFDFGDSVIQGEVDKRYQHILDLGKIPDFILHTPNSTVENLAVIEFKLASNSGKPLEDDLKKLVAFKRVTDTRYKNLVEVIIGNSEELKQAWKRVNDLSKAIGEEISVITYDVDKKDTERRIIRFQAENAI